MERFSVSVILLFVIALWGGTALSAQETSVASWDFDAVREGKVRDGAAAIDDPVTGNFRLVPGVKGQAIVMDGYTTRIVRPAAQVPKLGRDFSLEAWIALGAYPWNWAPIAAQESTVSLNSNLDAASWPDDITVNSRKAGFYFGVGPQGHLGLHVGAGGWVVCRSENLLPLRKWIHVAAVFRGGEGISLYIDGRKAGEATVKSDFRQASNEDLRIGMSRQKIEPSHPVRAFATLPCWYSVDGIVDDLRIYGQALSAEAVAGIFASAKPAAEPSAAQPAAANAGIEAAVTRWAQAWSARDVDAYLAAYASDFTAVGMTRANWEAQRRARITAPKSIDVQISDLKIEQQGDTASATFRQAYRSDRLNSTVTKTLKLALQNGQWRIVGETSQ